MKETIQPKETQMLLTQMGIIPERKADNIIDQLRKKSFEWQNLANGDIEIGPVLETIRNTPDINPPRTGHLGATWSYIARAGGGELSFNEGVRQKEVGYPLIFDLNETPAIDGTGGDVLYHPGTVIDSFGEPMLLPLFDKDGNPLSREDSHYVPYTFTKADGTLVPITQIHKQEIQSLGTDFKFVSEVFLGKSKRLEPLLNGLFAQLSQADDEPAEQAKILKLIVDRTVDSHGTILNTSLGRRNGNYLLGNEEYSPEEMTDLVLLSFEIAANPNILLSGEKDIPEKMPRISKEFLAAAMAVLDVDFAEHKKSMKPINPHFHWGGFSMAGAPPLIKGYFDSTAPGVNQLVSLMRQVNTEIPPVYYILMPASVFTLFPSTSNPQDLSLVEELIHQVHLETDHQRGKPNLQMEAIQRIVSEWYGSNKDSLSPTFTSRFIQNYSPLSNHLPETNNMTEPEGFKTLTFKQATMIVGYLKQMAR